MKRKKLYNNLIIAVLALAMTVSSLTVKAQTSEVCEVFSDVKHDSWYEESVQYVYDNGIMSGSNGAFKPSDNITRAQLVTTLYRIAGEPEVTDTSALTDFSDLAEGKYYTDAVCWAYAEGITTGSSGKFNPTDNLTRQQMIVFLHRYAIMSGANPYGGIEGVTIVYNASDYAITSLLWAVGNGFIVRNEFTFPNGDVVIDTNPTGYTTRAQVATILMRFCSEYGV